MKENIRTIEELKQLQMLPLDIKIRMTKQRIREWVNNFGINGVYVSFSGGKDSTVLLHIARELYPDMKAMFVDTPTQFPELKRFVKTHENVDIVKPKISFAEVCEKYGFPLISKEVAECAYGARRYLRSVLEENGGVAKTNIGTRNFVDSESILKNSGGGYDRKYRRLRGIGEFATSGNSRNSAEQGDMVRAPKSKIIGGGGERRRFAKLTGTLTEDNSIIPEYWKGFGQSASSDYVRTHDGERKKKNRGG